MLTQDLEQEAMLTQDLGQEAMLTQDLEQEAMRTQDLGQEAMLTQDPEQKVMLTQDLEQKVMPTLDLEQKVMPTLDLEQKAMLTQDLDNANSGSSAGSNANSGSSAGSNANSGSSASSCDSQSQWTDGLCPIISGVPLDMTKKAGYWYEVQRSANDFSGLDKCAKVFWRKPQNGVSYIINKSYSNVAHVTETTVSQMKKCGAKNYYTYHVPILGVVSRNQVYLDLDYDSHALFWTCENHGNKHRATFTLLSRHPNLPENIEEIEQKACAKFNLSMPPMVSFDLSGCNDAYDSYDFCENN
ncbi:GSCOCG00013501001-RA-CDS [Cotesia congregata]|nr:GSCOCG00013501001-RA-CDS [Cotesia congregata]